MLIEQPLEPMKLKQPNKKATLYLTFLVRSSFDAGRSRGTVTTVIRGCQKREY